MTVNTYQCISVPRHALVMVSLMACASLVLLATQGGTNTALPQLQSPKPLPYEDRNEEENGSSSKFTFTTCLCDIVQQNDAEVTRKNFEEVLPWLNMTAEQDLDRRHPNFPAQFLLNATKDKACSLIPTLLRIEWKNQHWQEVVIDHDKKLLLYSAIYDPNKGGESPCLRVLAMSKDTQPGRPLCQIWYSTHAPPTITTVSQVVHMDYQEKNSNRQMPYMLTCPLPPDAQDLPSAVSLVDSPCSPATNLLKVEGAKEREPSAYVSGNAPEDPQSLKEGWVPAVCGPALYYYTTDFSWRMVEWLELLKAMKFGRVFLYNSRVHPNLARVLQHYQQDGFVHLMDYQYPPPYINEPSMRRLWTVVERTKMFSQENIYFTDCLLRHMHQYRYIAHLDPDEMPVLLKDRNITDFLDHLTRTTTPQQLGFRLQWNIFYDDLEPKGEAALLPNYLWMMRHTRRPAKDMTTSPGTFKAFYDMDSTRVVFSHGVLRCTTGKCSYSSMPAVPASSGYIAHFTRKCKDNKSKDSCTLLKEDLTLHRYKEQVVPAVEKVLRELHLL